MTSPLDDIRATMKALQSMPTTRYVCTEFVPATSTDPESLGEMLMIKHTEGSVTTIYFHPDNYYQLHHALLRAEIARLQEHNPFGISVPLWGRTPEADKMQAAYWFYTDRKEAADKEQEKEGQSEVQQSVENGTAE